MTNLHQLLAICKHPMGVLLFDGFIILIYYLLTACMFNFQESMSTTPEFRNLHESHQQILYKKVMKSSQEPSREVRGGKSSGSWGSLLKGPLPVAL